MPPGMFFIWQKYSATRQTVFVTRKIVFFPPPRIFFTPQNHPKRHLEPPCGAPEKPENPALARASSAFEGTSYQER